MNITQLLEGISKRPEINSCRKLVTIETLAPNPSSNYHELWGGKLKSNLSSAATFFFFSIKSVNHGSLCFLSNVTCMQRLWPMTQPVVDADFLPGLKLYWPFTRSLAKCRCVSCLLLLDAAPVANGCAAVLCILFSYSVRAGSMTDEWLKVAVLPP